MRLLDANVLDGELLLVLHGSPVALFGAKAAIARILGCAVHLVTPGMMRRIKSGYRKPNEANVEFLARVAIIYTIAGGLSVEAPVIVRRPGVMSGDPVFRGTRVPPGRSSPCWGTNRRTRSHASTTPRCRRKSSRPLCSRPAACWSAKHHGLTDDDEIVCTDRGMIEPRCCT